MLRNIYEILRMMKESLEDELEQLLSNGDAYCASFNDKIPEARVREIQDEIRKIEEILSDSTAIK